VARQKVVYGCGCGFKTRELEKALGHADSTGHILTANGTIDPDVQPQKSGKPGSKAASVVRYATTGELDDLRKKFTRWGYRKS